MVSLLRDDARRTPWIRLAVIGQSREGRALWLARVADPQGPPPARTARLFVLFRQHGDEPAPTEAALGLLRRVAAGRYHPPDGVTLYLAPMVNPDGATLGTRENGARADLNRDWGVFAQPETRAVARAVRQIRPQVVVDAHNWDPGDPFNADCVEVSRDTKTSLARAAQAMQAEAVGALGDAGYSVSATTYGADADPRLAHRWFAAQGIVSCLVETHSGSPRDAADFRRRQGVYVALIQDVARRYAGRHAALDALEGRSPASDREASLFPPPSAPPKPGTATTLPPPPRLLWPWALLPYGLALFAAFVSRGNSARPRIPHPPPLSFRKARGARLDNVFTLSFRKERVARLAVPGEVSRRVRYTPVDPF